MTDSLMDKRLSRLKEAQERFDRNNRISIPKIQRVPMFLRQNERFYKYCTPKIISFGPIHHNAKILKEGEHYKLLWTSIFVAEYGKKTDQDANEACKVLLKKIEDNIEELKNMFTEDAIEGYNDDDLAWILFVDGCSLLHFMKNVDDQNPKALNLKFDQLMYIWRDIDLLENQLPIKMLEILCKGTGIDLGFLIYNWSGMGYCKRQRGMVMIQLDRMPFHLLDFVRSIYLLPDYISNIEEHIQMETQSEGSVHNSMGENTIQDQEVMIQLDPMPFDLLDFGRSMSPNNISNIEEHGQMETPCEGSEHNPMGRNITQVQEDSDEEENNLNWNTYKSIRDLKTVGVRVVANKTDEWNWSNISFKSKWFSGELRLPVFLFNDITPYAFRNFIAYEMCPDVDCNYECCSFFSFMDSLIDNAEDVKELRLAGVFQNLLGSDEELAKLLNDLGDDLPTKMSCHFGSTKAVAYSKKYILIKAEIEKHYKNKWKTWLAQAYNTHFNTPWAMIALLAAVLALVLTFIQTWFAINPK